MWATSTERTLSISFFSVGSCVSASSSAEVFPPGFFVFCLSSEPASSDGSCGLYALASSSRDPATLSGTSPSFSPVETPGVTSWLGVFISSVSGALKVPIPLKTSSGELLSSGFPKM
uniref:Putative secreted protein n=1 Tax=Ixodes ricinus TaxID=34613 RepID=A0A6B0ULM3_IXORI